MKNIQDCAKLYLNLINKRYIFSLENGIEFSVVFKSGNFAHLIGLHKLVDLNVLKKKSANLLFDEILNGTIKPSFIESSVKYYLIKNRIKYFENIFDLLNKEKTKVIVDFDKTLISGETQLDNTKYILYKIKDGGYFLLTIGNKGNGEYPETLFYEISKMYISGQNLLEISDIKIVENKKKKST